MPSGDIFGFCWKPYKRRDSGPKKVDAKETRTAEGYFWVLPTPHPLPTGRFGGVYLKPHSDCPNSPGDSFSPFTVSIALLNRSVSGSYNTCMKKRSTNGNKLLICSELIPWHHSLSCRFLTNSVMLEAFNIVKGA